MKKGKTSKIQGLNCAKVVYGTVDSVKLKSIYLNIQTWVEPIYECENWTRTVLNMSRAIKHAVYESVDRKLFEEKFIVDLDLRSSGISLGKKSFMNLEVNFYLIEDNKDFTRVIFLDIFYFDVNKDDLNRLGEYKFSKNKIKFRITSFEWMFNIECMSCCFNEIRFR